MAAKILSIYYKKNKLGCAYYEQKTTTLYLMSDIPEEKEFRHIRSREFWNFLHAFSAFICIPCFLQIELFISGLTDVMCLEMCY